MPMFPNGLHRLRDFLRNRAGPVTPAVSPLAGYNLVAVRNGSTIALNPFATLRGS